MSGGPDPAYVLARRGLLDALDALGPHRESVVLVGAQAVYLRLGPPQIAVPEYTTDADIGLDPRSLKELPPLDELLRGTGFRPGEDLGSWISASGVEVDFLVPERLGGGGRRGARLRGHGKRIARKVRGLEATVLDYEERLIASLEPDRDPRTFRIRVAGPAALLVAKLHKIMERAEEPKRSENKDALDVLRILQAVPTSLLADRFRRFLDDEIAATVTREGIGYLKELFAKSAGKGAQMAALAAVPLENPDTILASCASLATDLLAELEGPSP